MKIQPTVSLNGKIRLPGDKSISHRAAILASMATGETRIENYATNADCDSTLDCLRNLGVEIRRENSTVYVKGVGKNGFVKPLRELDCGNSGTTMRLLAGVLAGQNFDSVLVGDASLSKRPMRRIIQPLTQMGAQIDSDDGCAPLKIFGRNPLQAISYKMPVASAQVKSCVLLAGLNSDGRSSVIENTRDTSIRDHTERMLRWFEADVVSNTRLGFNDSGEISVSGESELTARNLQIPGDVSSAAFFLIAAACLPGSDLIMENVGLNKTRAFTVQLVQIFGGQVEITNKREVCNESVGDIRVIGKKSLPRIKSGDLLNRNSIPLIIDEIPILAVFGTQLWNGLAIRGAEELRVKESDRIAAIVENLRRMNATVEEFPDGFRVEKSKLKGATVDSFGDHRIAMAFAVAALLATGESEIVGAHAASVSFPEFFQTLASIRK